MLGAVLMATIKEIADMLGVSTATVSNVINGKTKKVSKKNIERMNCDCYIYSHSPTHFLGSTQGPIRGKKNLDSANFLGNFSFCSIRIDR